MSRKTRREQPRRASAQALTPERRTHGPVTLTPTQIVDANGEIGRPYVAIDLLTRMFRSGAITAEMKLAGDAFHDNFRRSQIDGRRCSDIGRVTGIGRAEPDQTRTIAANRAVWAAMRAVGDPGASVLWHVIGLQSTLQEWAQRQRWNGREVNPMQASGILVCALGALAGQSAPVARTHRSARTPVVAAAAVRVAAR